MMKMIMTTVRLQLRPTTIFHKHTSFDTTHTLYCTAATDAARAAADIVLTEPGLSTIVHGIVIARCIFVRIRNFVTYRIAATLQLLTFFFIAVYAFRPVCLFLYFCVYVFASVFLVVFLLASRLYILRRHQIVFLHTRESLIINYDFNHIPYHSCLFSHLRLTLCQQIGPPIHLHVGRY